MEFNGAPLSGDPEVLHHIEEYFRTVERIPIVRKQIRKILELVPTVFPQNWKSPSTYEQFSPEEQSGHSKIANAGIFTCGGSTIQRVIELALDFKKLCEKRS